MVKNKYNRVIGGFRGFKDIFMKDPPAKQCDIGPYAADRVDHISSRYFPEQGSQYNKWKTDQHEQDKNGKGINAEDKTNCLPEYSHSIERLIYRREINFPFINEYKKISENCASLKHSELSANRFKILSPPNGTFDFLNIHIMKPLFILLFLSLSFIATAQTSKTVYPSGLKVGDKAPAFNTTDQAGKKLKLKNILKHGEAVLIFYRGQWCPYCNKELGRINDSLSLFAEKGATVIAITPETPENIQKTIEKTKASFSIIEDKTMSIMKSYRVNFAVDDATVAKYRTYGIDFDKANGSNGANLPIPATYIIGKNGLIKYVFFSPDYRLRPSVKELLDNL